MAGVLGAYVAHGCFSPEIVVDRCSVRCTGADECPPGLACVDGYCGWPGATQSCIALPPPVPLYTTPLDDDDEPPPSHPPPSESADAGDPASTLVDSTDASVEIDEPLSGAPCDALTGIALDPCVLPEPCLGLPYVVAFRPKEGSDFVWRATEKPPGLDFSPEALTLSGVAQGSGPLTLEARDARGGVVRRSTFALSARTSCSVGFVVNEDGGARLHLSDRERLASVIDVVLPSELAPGEGVVDFAFSPDGAWLLLRVGGPEGFQRVALYSAPDWSERALPELTGSVVQYAWAPDSAAVALVLQTDASTFLGGFRLPPSAAASEPVAAGEAFAAVPTPSDTRPVWFAQRFVGFLSGEGQFDNSRLLYFAGLGDDGFDAPAQKIGDSYFEDADTSVRLEGADEGLFVFASFLQSPRVLDFFVPTSDDLFGVVHEADAITSPDRRHVARAVDGRLEVHRAPPAPPDTSRVLVASADGCGRFLGWSKAGDRLACVTDGAEGGSLRIFDFDGAFVAPSVPVEGSYAYADATAFGRRRAFSPGGRWFVFLNNFQLYVADVGNVAGSRLLQTRAPKSIDAFLNPELAFSPDDRFLIRHQSGRLFLMSLVEGEELPVASPVAESLRCDENQCASPEAWCGDPSSSSSVVSWASDSRSALYPDAAGELHLLRVKPPAGAALFDLDDESLRPGCGSGCLGSYALQP